MIDTVVPIVEGHGEESAVPVLLRRFFGDRNRFDIKVQRPIRRQKDAFLNKPDEFRRSLELAAGKAGKNGCILIIIDSDDGCAAAIQATLKSRADEFRPSIPCFIVCPTTEYESWFIAAARSLRGHPRVRDDAAPPDDPERIVNAKKFLQRNLLKDDEYYSETVDQAKFTSFFRSRKRPAAGRFESSQRNWIACSSCSAPA